MCAFVAEQMAAIGLSDVRLEPVPVDAWRFRGASLAVDGDVLPCSSFGGVPGTPPDGLEGELVFVGEGSRGELAGRDLRGRIALFDWRGDQLFWPSLTAAELGAAGALAVICTCLPGARYYQGERALGSFDGMWLAGSPPLAYVAHEDATRLIERLRGGTLRARLHVDAEITLNATAHNVDGHAAGAQRRGADRHRGPSRLLVRGGLRRRDGSRRDARHRQGARRRRLRAGTADRLHLPHGRGVRAHRRGVRLADRRLVADRARAPGVGAGGPALHQHRGHRHGLPDGNRPASRVAALRPRRRLARAPRRPAAARHGVGRAAHGHRAVAVRRRRRAQPRGGRPGRRVHAHRVPHPARSPRARRPGLPRRCDQAPCAARDRGRPQAGGALRPGRTLAAAPPSQRSRGAAALRRRHAAPARGARPPRGGGRPAGRLRGCPCGLPRRCDGRRGPQRHGQAGSLLSPGAHRPGGALVGLAQPRARPPARCGARARRAQRAHGPAERGRVRARRGAAPARPPRHHLGRRVPDALAQPVDASWRACAARPARARPGRGSRMPSRRPGAAPSRMRRSGSTASPGDSRRPRAYSPRRSPASSQRSSAATRAGTRRRSRWAART